MTSTAVPAATLLEPATASGRTDVSRPVWTDAPTSALVELAVRRGEGHLVGDGALAVTTGAHTGRSPLDKFVVRDDATAEAVWWGDVNRPLPVAAFEVLETDVRAYLARRERFVQHLTAGAAPAWSVPVTVVAEQAWHALFARALFPPGRGSASRDDRNQGWTVLHAPGFDADPERHGTRSATVIALSLSRRLVVIAGTAYAGEIKKSLFTALQWLLPRAGVTTMHCSANVGGDGDVALFFGLSGTGKTTLSVQPGRTLIGDDEHGWDDDGIFNFEGGCYAKVIDLSAEAEPLIYRAAHGFGTVLENVVFEPATRNIDFGDQTFTENTRAAFPLAALPNAAPVGIGAQPRHVAFLTADAFGVLPTVARLTFDQALYWYLSGYTAKLAGTERDVTTPEATFSACFGAPFLPLPPARYAELLGERLRRFRPDVWLVNTGWSGGPYGVGRRMPIALTRAVVAAVLDGSLADVPTDRDPLWGFAVPRSIPGAPDAPVAQRATWADGAAFDATERRLAEAFTANFEQFAKMVAPEVAAAGPRAVRGGAARGEQART